jgi:hypothetical protein
MSAPSLQANHRVFVLNVTAATLDAGSGSSRRRLAASKFMELTSAEYAESIIDTWYDAGSLRVYQRPLPAGSYAGGNLVLGNSLLITGVDQ